MASTISTAPIRSSRCGRSCRGRRRRARSVIHSAARPKRQVDPEDQRPVQLLGEHAAEHRPEHAGGHEHRGDQALVAGTLLGRDDVGDDGLGQRDQAAAADALQAAGEDQGQHRGGERAGDRAQDEQRDAGQQHGAAAVDVAELAVERRHRGRAQQVGGDHPRQVVEVAQLAADGRQCRRDDGLVERAQEHRQHDADQDAADRGMIERRRGRRGGAHARLRYGRVGPTYCR